MNKLQKDLRRYKRYRLLVMELLFVQAITFLLLIQNSLSAGDTGKLIERGLYLVAATAALLLGWWALGLVVTRATTTCRLFALGATEEQALALAKAAVGIDATQSLRETWDNYYLNHRAQIDATDKTFRKLMTGKYRMRAEWLEDGGDQPLLATFASVIHAGKKTPEDAAEAFNAQLMADGEQGNARIFDLAADPATPRAVKFPAVTLILIAGSFYSYSGNLFLPEMNWWYFGMGITLALSFATVLWMIHGHLTGKFKYRTAMRPATRAVTVIIMSPLIFMLYWGTVTLGIGSAYTEMAGVAGAKAFHVVKIQRRTEFGIKYCLRSQGFMRAVFFYDDCTLSPEAFAKMKEGDVTYGVKVTELGTLLQGIKKP